MADANVSIEKISQVRAKVDASLADVTAALEAANGDVQAAIAQLSQAERARSAERSAYPQGPARPPSTPPKREAAAPKNPTRRQRGPLIALILIALVGGGLLVHRVVESYGLGKTQGAVAEAVCVPATYQEMTSLASMAAQGKLLLPELKSRTAAVRATLVASLVAKQLGSADLDRSLTVNAAPIVEKVGQLCPEVAKNPAELESALGLLGTFIQANGPSAVPVP